MLVHMILGVYFTYSFASLLLSKGNMLEYMGHGVIDVKSQLALSSFLNPYKPSTCFMVVKTVLLNHYNPTGQNVFAEHLQAFNVLCGSQNGSVGQATLDPPPPFQSDT